MIYYVLLYVTLLTGLFPLIMFIGKGNHLNKQNNYVLPLILLIAVSSIYEYVVSGVLKISVIPWYQIHSLLEFLALYYLFIKLIVQRPKWFFLTFLGLFLLIYVYSFFCLKEDSAFLAKSINKSFLTLFIMWCSFLWVKQIFDQKKILSLYKESSLYVVMGLFFYYSTTISLFMLSSYIYNNDIYFNDYWLVNIIASLILRIILSIGVWKMK